MTTVPYETSAQIVYRQILESILTGELAPGDRLAESALADRWGVSRTPVREALRRMAQEGFVLFVPGLGARLADPDPDEVVDAFDIRTRLECLALEMALPRLTGGDLWRLDECLEGDRDATAFPGPDVRFHLELVRCSGSSTLTGILRGLLPRIYVFRTFYVDSRSAWSEIVGEHAELVETLRRGEGERACLLLRRHLEFSLDETREGLQRRGRRPLLDRSKPRSPAP